jgi:hypothetical protein
VDTVQEDRVEVVSDLKEWYTNTFSFVWEEEEKENEEEHWDGIDQ